MIVPHLDRIKRGTGSLILAMVLTACDPNTLNQMANDVAAVSDQAGQRNVHDWLATGSSEVCADPDVRATLSKFLKPSAALPFGEESSQMSREELDSLVDELQFDYQLTQLTAFEQDLAAVTCDTNVVMRIRGKTWSPMRVQYRIAPSSDNAGQFILTADPGDLPMIARLLVGTMVAGIVRERAPQLESVANVSDENQPQFNDSANAM